MISHPIDSIGITEAEEFCNLLKETGSFDELEIKILKAMFEIKENRNVMKSSANDISRTANVSVTNAYKYLYSLQERGIVESQKNDDMKNKLFWLTDSTNPFPRILSYVARDYLKKRELFFEIEKMYRKLRPTHGVWCGEKVFEHYDSGFSEKAAVLFDMAKNEILITTDRFFDDFVILDALKRAAAKGTKVMIITEETSPETTEKLKKTGIEVKIGYGWPYIILVDNSHGLTVDKEGKGIWFLNQKTDFKPKFLEFWEKANEV